MARNMPRMVGMAALLLLPLLLLLSGTATATSYPSADQYSLRNHYRITRRSAGHEILPTVPTDYDEDEERQRQAVSLTELLQLWEPEHREEERRPQRGDIEVTTKGVERGDVPVIGKRRKLVRRQAQDRMWGFAEDDGMLTSDDEARPTPHPHRKHHRNSGLIETQGGNDPMRWRGPEEETRQRPGLKDRRRLDEEARRRQQEEQRQRMYEMRRTPEETRRRDGPRQHENGNPAQSDENETRRRQQEEQRQRLYEMRRTQEETQRQDSQRQHELRNPAQTYENETRRRQEEEQRQRAAAYDLRRRQDEQQRRENPRQSDSDRRRQPDNRDDETRRRQEQEERQRAYEARRREEEQRQSENDDRRKQSDNRDDETRRRQEQEERQRAYEARRREEEQRQSENDDRRKQPDNRDDETRRRQEQEERQRAYEARRREEEQRQRGRNPPTDAGDTYEKRMQEWRKMKEEHDRLVRERQQQQQQHHPQQDPQRPEAQTKNQDELENEQKLQEYIRRNTPIVVPPSANRDPASDRIRENEQVRRAEHERRLEEERRRKQVQEESRRLAEEERMRRTHDGATDAGRDKPKHRGTSSVRPRWPAITSRTPVENSSNTRRPIPQNRPAENDARYLESRRNEAAASNSRRPSLEAEEEEERLKKLKGMPVSATIIVRSTDTGANRTNTSPPALNLRFGENIDFPGFSPNRRGPEASRFPAPVTRRPPVPSPQPCVWAIVVCCQQHRQQEPNQAMKVTRCFEATNCPGASWDVDRRCSEANVRAANEEIRQFYLKGQERNY